MTWAGHKQRMGVRRFVMWVRDAITSAGGDRVNEDRVGYAGQLAWVIDGATDLYADTTLPADSDVLWLVDTIAEQLRQADADGPVADLPGLLETVAQHVCRQLDVLGFPADRVPPACSLAVATDQGGTFAVARVGDATAVVAGAEPVVLATGFFDRREAAAVGAQRAGQPPDQVRAGQHGRRLQTMIDGGPESVFSGHPRRVLRPHTLTRTWAGTLAVLLCTDGFARLVTDHGLYVTWDALIADAVEKGLGYLEKLLRDTETDPEAGAAAAGRGRFKAADDAAAVLLVPTMEEPR